MEFEMSYPLVADSDFPSVKYTTDEDGVHWVVFYDDSQPGQVSRTVIRADTVLAVAFKMCVDEVETEWAKRHLESQGYRIEKRTAASYGPRLGPWAKMLGLGS